MCNGVSASALEQAADTSKKRRVAFIQNWEEEQIAEFERQWFRYSKLFMRVALKGSKVS